MKFFLILGCCKVTYYIFFIQVSLVTSGPRRGPTFNNRWWNDRRSWNLRTTNSREKASPKGANHIQSCPCSPPSGTIRENLLLSAGSIPFGHSTRGYSHSPPSGTAGCYLRNLNTEPTLKSKACLKCLYFTKIISALCCYLEYFSYLYTIN